MSAKTNEQIEDKRAMLKALAAERDQTVFDLAYACIADAIRHQDTTLATHLKLDLAGFYFTLRSDYKKAKLLCEEALPEVERWENLYLLANVNKRIGSYAYFLADYSAAGQHYNAARQILEEMENKSREAELELADIYYNLCIAYRTDEYNEYRIEMNNKALGIFLKHGEMIRVGRSYNLSGNVLFDKGQHEAALHQYLQSLEIFENTNNATDTNITYCYNNVGNCYRQLAMYEEALPFFNKSLTIREAVGSPNEVAVTLMLMGMMYFAKGDITRSEDHLLQAIKIFKDLSNTFDISHAALQLANLYKHQQDFKMACEYMDLHLSLQTDLNKEDKRRSIAEALAASRMEQKESEARLLRQKNAEIEEYAKKLQTSNEELNQFAHIVSHDLKEPLRMISSYTGLLGERMNIDDPQTRQFMAFITEGTVRMNHLINELLEYSKVGASCKIQPTDLNDVLKIARMNLSGLLNDKGGVIEDIALPTIDTDKTMMLQLFQNLLGNGLKYNSSPIPTVGVHYKISKDNIELHFHDNGIGIPEECRQKVFEIFRRLPDSKDICGSGIGLSICHKIVHQLKGKIWIEENKPEGSIFKVSLPMR